MSSQGKTTLTLYITSFIDYYVKMPIQNYNILPIFVRLFLNHPGMILSSSEVPGTPKPQNNCKKDIFNDELKDVQCNKYDKILHLCIF